MSTKIHSLLGVAAMALMVSAGTALAATQTVTEKTSTVNPDGSVSYQSHTVVKDAPATPVVATTTATTSTTEVVTPVTFYYYDTDAGVIVAQSDLTQDVFDIWDADGNTYIDNHEFYTNAMVVYEPIEYSKRTYQDVDADGRLELTQEEYTFRLQKLPYYSKVNTDDKDGLTVYEFTGLGFRDVDVDSNNQISYDELKKAFYGQAWDAANPDLYNK